MGLFSLEHSRFAHRADFALYGAAVAALATFLLLTGPPAQGLALALWVAAGMAGWPPLEYALHRHVLHRVQPFRGWHERHHQRPTALIGSPTLFSASLFFGLVFLPALALGDHWIASALTLGLVSGYLAYSVTHHATHHWRGQGAWLLRRKRWHALHHHAPATNPGCYGVTGAFWDHACGSARSAAPAAVGR